MDAKAARSHLFALARLEDFVAERDRLSAALKAAGDKPGAAALKKLPRPTVNVWALNQVAQKHPALLAEVLASGDEQTGDVRSRTVKFRAAIARVVAAAEKLLTDAGRPASPAVLRKIERALEAAPFADADDQAALRAGELSRDLAPDEDDDPLAAMLGASLAGATPAPEKAPAAKATVKDHQAAELRRLRDSLAAAETRRRTAASDASLAEERARSAAVDVQRAQKTLLAAEQRQAETQQALAEADAELDELRAALEKAQS